MLSSAILNHRYCFPNNSDCFSTETLVRDAICFPLQALSPHVLGWSAQSSDGNHGINRNWTWNLKMPKRSGDSKPLNIRDSSRWTFGGVYVMLIADLMLIATFATKVHPTTSRLLPNKLLWQHLGLPETIASGYPFHAEGCEKLLRRWTTAPSKNLQHLGSNMKCSFWFGVLKMVFCSESNS